MEEILSTGTEFLFWYATVEFIGFTYRHIRCQVIPNHCYDQVVSSDMRNISHYKVGTQHDNLKLYVHDYLIQRGEKKSVCNVEENLFDVCLVTFEHYYY